MTAATDNAMTMIPTSSASLESRIAALEARVGKISKTNKPPATEVSDRLTKLQQAMDVHLNQAGISGMWKESLTLLKELDPDLSLTYQQQPLLYKRQQVLAASSSHLQQDMAQLDTLLKLLTTDATQSSRELRLDDVVQAPIVASSQYTQSPKDQERLETVRLQYEQIGKRVEQLQERLQSLLQIYQTCMVASSQKLLLAQEQIERK